MKDYAKLAVEAAQKAGADYADARVCHLRCEELVVKNGQVADANSPVELGMGVRVLKDGCFGFAAAPLPKDGREGLARELAKKAVRSSQDLAPAVVTPRTLAGEEGNTGEYETPVQVDPFLVPLGDKLDLLREAEATMAGREETVSRMASSSIRREEQWQVSSEGADLHQVLIRSGAGVSCTSAANGHVETRSYPASFGGNYATAGWEFVVAMNLASQGLRVRDESVALCWADPCPGGRRTMIVGASQLMLQIHESVGHPNELDRVFGHEIDLAGSSFATTDKLAKFQYGSEHVNLVADSTLPGGLDTRGWDDECVPSRMWYVVREGVFSGYHTSREWAGKLEDERSTGCARAEGWYNPPIIRMTNLSLLPGKWDLGDLLKDTEDGAIVLDTVKMWSIDQRRLNFQFTSEIGWEVKDGDLGRMLRSPTYQGNTPEFWNSCDAVCNEDYWQLYGVPNCGKGNPMQVAEMSHGAAPARFRNVTFVDAGH